MLHDLTPGKQGFTLLEALVAVAVVALLLVPTLQSIVTSTATSRAAGRQLGARLVLDRLLVGLPLARGIKPGRRSGTDSGFAWTVDATPLANAPRGAEGEAPAFVPYRVRLSVVAAQGSISSLETVRLGPAPPPPPLPDNSASAVSRCSRFSPASRFRRRRSSR